jgi:hypothetical protein
MSRLKLAVEQIVFARNYTIGLFNQTPTDDWFRLLQLRQVHLTEEAVAFLHAGCNN